VRGSAAFPGTQVAGRMSLPSGAVLSRRAQELLVDGCRASGASTILVPALYCPDMVVAIRAAGLEVLYYDTDPDLAPSVTSLEKRLCDGCAVIWHHPFGSYLVPPSYPGIMIIEDACYSFRTITSSGLDDQRARLCVCSLRKEFRLSMGGLAFGRMTGNLQSRSKRTHHAVVSKFRQVNLAMSISDGQGATEAVRKGMRDRLPRVSTFASVLSQIPLLSSRRDKVVKALRSASILAWYWQSRVPGLSRDEAPVAWELWQRLFLVPLPEADSSSLDLVASISADRW
jgi:hypothetical protein